MNTSILTVVLAGALLAGQDGNPIWQNSYTKAQEVGAAQKKPLAIVFGSGANGWTKVVRDASPAPDVTQLLAAQYVCVYLDTTTPEGKKLAQDFGVTQATGLVLSDRAGATQAFWHQGDLTNQAMTAYLKKYADPQLVVRGTESANSNRTSFYPSSDINWNSASPFGNGADCPT